MRPRLVGELPRRQASLRDLSREHPAVVAHGRPVEGADCFCHCSADPVFDAFVHKHAIIKVAFDGIDGSRQGLSAEESK